MEIILREPRTFIGEKYNITITETEEQFLGNNIGFYAFDHIILYKDSRKVIAAKKRFRPFQKRYFDIKYGEIKGYFKQLTWFKPSFEMELNGIKWEIIHHWGKKTSVFKNSVQIASIVQSNDISFNKNDTYKILVNDDEDFIPIILAVMILDAPGNESSSNNMVLIDLGNVGGEKQPFDTKWRPAAKN